MVVEVEERMCAGPRVEQALASLTPIPVGALILLGQAWLDELLLGHPKRFEERFGMLD